MSDEELRRRREALNVRLAELKPRWAPRKQTRKAAVLSEAAKRYLLDQSAPSNVDALIKQWYLVDELSLVEIGARLGVSRQTIGRKLEAMGVPRRSRGRPKAKQGV